MKIAIFTDAFLPQKNGVVSHLLDIIPHLEIEHEVHLFTFSDKKRSKNTTVNIVQSKHTINLPLYPDLKMAPPFSLEFYKKFKEVDPDIVHFHTPLTVSSNGILLAKLFKKPVVSTFNTYFMDDTYIKIISKRIPGVHSVIKKTVWEYLNFFYGYSDVVITPSHSTKYDLVDLGFKRDIKVISYGIDIDTFNSAPINKLPYSPYILTVSRLSKEKNLSVLLKAFSVVKKSLADVNLVIVGSGPEKQNLIKLSKELYIDKHTFFVGSMKRNELISSGIYKNAECFVSTSNSETLGLSILEAAASGCPVIGSTEKASGEVINSKGILCEPNDIDGFANAMKKILTDSKYKKELSQKSHSLAKNHDIRISANMFCDLYKNTIKNKKS